jgi:hypothetical protein
MSPARLATVSAFYKNSFPMLKEGSQELTDAIDVAILFAVVDSIHDFWPERKTKGEEEEGDDDSLSPEARAARIADVRKRLTEAIGRFLGVRAGTTIEEMLRGLTGGAVKSTSNIEDNTIDYVKKTFYPFNQRESFITVDTILKEWAFSSPKYANIWSNYKAALLTLPNRLQIRPEGRSIKSLETAELNTVAFFILGYMNPNAQPGAGATANFTFDMSPRDVGKIFARIPQAYNAIFPQNVSDSASTSFSALLGRAHYFRANGDDAGAAGAVTQVFRSNAFSAGRYTLQFNDAGFKKGNEYGFAIDIANNSTGEKSVIKFGAGTGQQGPSVNYLMDIVHKPGTIRTAVPKLPQVAKLNGLQNIPTPDLFDVLFDIKRGGDHEQMICGRRKMAFGGGQMGGSAEGTIGITGDRMAKQFRDLMQLTGGYHGTTGVIDISRFLGGALSEEELAAQTLDFRRQSVLGKLNIVSASATAAGDIYDALVAMQTEVARGARMGTVFMDMVDISTPAGREDHTKAAATAATYILRLRMIDIYRHITSLIAKSKTVVAGVLAVRPAEAIVKIPVTKAALPDTITRLESAVDVLETFINGIEELESMKISFDTTKTREPIFIKLFDEKNRLIKGVVSSLFNFSAGPYLQTETGLMQTIARLLLSRNARRPEAIKVQINAQRDQYFAARDLAKEAFFNPDLKAAVEAATDITTGLSVAQIIGQERPGDGKQGIIEVLQELKTLYEAAVKVVPVVPVPGAMDVVVGGSKQTGGAGSPLQFRDMHDLFVELCLDASNALPDEKAYGAQLKALADRYAVVAPPIAAKIKELDSTMRDERQESELSAARVALEKADFLQHMPATLTLNELEVKWVSGIDELRSHALDDYGLPFEETVATDIISYILSFRTIRLPTLELGVEPGNTFDLTEKEVYPTVDATINTVGKSFGGRDLVIINDLGGIFLQKVPVELFILRVLARIGTDILNPVRAKKAGKPVPVANPNVVVTRYSSPNGWGEVPSLLYTAAGAPLGVGIPPALRQIVTGGGLEESDEEVSNAGGSSSGSSRRGLYSGLRKRGGSGSTPEL